MDPATIGALITTGGSLLGKLFGGGGEKTTSTIDYKALRRAAEKGGFNPLTALRAGGGAGFTTTHHPALASGEFIADAMAGVGNIVASIDPMRDATAKLEHEIKVATLANIQADTAARLHATRNIGGAPSSSGPRQVRAVSPLATPAAAATVPVAAGGNPDRMVQTQVTVTNPYPPGFVVDTTMPDADGYETRLGEPGGIPGAAITGWADLKANYPILKLLDSHPMAESARQVGLYGDRQWKRLRREWAGWNDVKPGLARPTRLPAPSW